MSTCPEGHQSASDDYCDVCGSPIEDPSGSTPGPGTAAASAPAQPSGGPAPATVACPNCQSENVPDALFCEACGYDFTTGTMPRPWVSPFAAQQDEAPADEQPGDPSTPLEDQQAAAPPIEPAETTDDPAESEVPSTPLEDQQAAAPPIEPVETTDDPAESEVPSTPLEDQQAAAPPIEPVETTDDPVESEDLSTPLEDQQDADEDSFAWVAELWVDPDWYRHQEPPDPMPSPGLPEVVPLHKRSVLVGRPSRSRGITPDIDCDSDPGASRRQAQLTTDGRRWWVEDLDSSNGTYVAGAAEGLPGRPIPVGQRHELDPDDRIYLGAWTRLVIRRATDEERETLAP